jgi:hypothetical protein
MKDNAAYVILDKALSTLKRFPLALLFSALGAGCAIYMIKYNLEPEQDHLRYLNFIFSCYLGMLLFIAIPIFVERKNWDKKNNILLHFLGIVALCGYYFLLPNHFFLLHNIRFILLSLSLHFLIAFIPFFQYNEPNGFWQYNKSLFLRILLSVLYSGVLFLGLVLAIAAVDQLFRVNINHKAYAYLWVLTSGIFNTWFFLSGVPKEFSTLESKLDYPNGLKIFTQFVLLPILAIYWIILYAYLFKILLQMEWPEGWVSYLVLFFSIAGILSLLLIYPVRNDAGNKWIPPFSRFFYLAIFPLILLLFFAIKRRISDYGITEPRYFVLLLALWLLFIATYFLISKSKNIKLIPISLFIISLLSSFGPWGAFSVSHRSQTKHLTKLLEQNNMLQNGKFTKSKEKIPNDAAQEIVSDYMVKSHGLESMQSFFSFSLDSLNKLDSNSKGNRYLESQRILTAMGLDHENIYESSASKYFDYNAEITYSSAIEGYTYFISNYSYASDSENADYTLDSVVYKLHFDAEQNILSLNSKSSSLRFNLNEMHDEIEKNDSLNTNQLPIKYLLQESKSIGLSAKIIVNQMQGRVENKQATFEFFRATIFIKKE